MTRRALKARLKLIERSLDLLNRKDEILRRTCSELAEELFAALERCQGLLPESCECCPSAVPCLCEDCTKARLCIEVNARAYEEILLEEQRLMETSGLVKPAPAVEERH